MKKLVIPTVFVKNGEIYFDKACSNPFSCPGGFSAARFYGNQDADALCIMEFSLTDEEHDRNIGVIKRQIKDAEIPVYAGGFVKRFEDVKKYFYTGAEKVLFVPSPAIQEGALEEAGKRFGKDKLVYVIPAQDITEAKTVEGLVGGYYMEQATPEALEQLKGVSTLPVLASYDGMLAKEGILLLKPEQVCAVTGNLIGSPDFDRMAFKCLGKAEGLSMNFLSSTLKWSDFKLNADGMVPVIVQDYKTNEVLMLAYMNEEAFRETILSGKMTYWSRSRNELWKKGLTSGHFQFVKSLTADCDMDTILAKVSQVDAACHTGSYSCFFHEIVKKEFENYSPSKVFDDVFGVIMDRKLHPKEGSYTNYLFEKGIDKILKKVGEEATEIVIAAKNPDPEEIKYEISDFLYHVMVLMAEKGVTWEDITRELANR